MATAKSIVVGIDGSRAAVAAAQWAADKANGNDIALRLLYVIDRRRGFTPSVIKAQSAVAEAALQDALTAVEATHGQLRVELETVDGDPGTVLIEASRSAGLLCAGSPKAAPHGPSDSLAAIMASSAHCSVAIVPATQYSVQPRTGWIVTLLDSSTSDYEVLQHAMEEARLRALPLLAVTTNGRSAANIGRDQKDVEGDRLDTSLKECLGNWAVGYPGIEARVVHTDQLVAYVTEHQASIRLVVLGAEHHHEIAQLVELTRSGPLHDANLSVLVVRGLQV
ncbi:universal stress protein [uncultured Mycobacterium sp.]|uniref:universal stress protein n=1 Tax=uncultured Mycobacterium sp. TaxID=171292 RepID=UPI0035CA314F